MKHYAIVGNSRHAAGGTGKSICQRHYGTVKVITAESSRVKVVLNLVNKYVDGGIRKRNERITDGIIRIINQEYALEDLTIKRAAQIKCGFSRKRKEIKIGAMPAVEYNETKGISLRSYSLLNQELLMKDQKIQEISDDQFEFLQDLVKLLDIRKDMPPNLDDWKTIIKERIKNDKRTIKN